MKTCKSGRHQYEGRRCPVCTAAYRAAYYAANREKVRATAAAWQAANREKVRAMAAAWRVANPEKFRAAVDKWHAAHPEKHKASVAKWHAAHPEKHKAAVAKWHASHPGKVKAARVAYVGRLSAGYIADLLGVRAKDVPTELMEAKRVEIKLKRLIKEMKK